MKKWHTVLVAFAVANSANGAVLNREGSASSYGFLRLTPAYNSESVLLRWFEGAGGFGTDTSLPSEDAEASGSYERKYSEVSSSASIYDDGRYALGFGFVQDGGFFMMNNSSEAEQISIIYSYAFSSFASSTRGVRAAADAGFFLRTEGPGGERTMIADGSGVKSLVSRSGFVDDSSRGEDVLDFILGPGQDLTLMFGVDARAMVEAVPSPIPLPAAAWMLLSAFGGLALPRLTRRLSIMRCGASSAS